jgi:hypothetical protein
MKAINEALAKLQSELRPILKDSENPFFKSKYADLASVSRILYPLMSKHGLSVTHHGSYANNQFVMTTVLRHDSGEHLESSWPIFSKDNSSQAIASAWSYARRYSLMGIVGATSSDDDDAEASESRAESKTVNTAVEPQKAAVEPINYDKPAPYGETLIPFGSHKGKTLNSVSDRDAKGAIDWAKSKGKFTEFATRGTLYLQEKNLSTSDLVPNFDPSDDLPF